MIVIIIIIFIITMIIIISYKAHWSHHTQKTVQSAHLQIRKKKKHVHIYIQYIYIRQSHAPAANASTKPELGARCTENN